MRMCVGKKIKSYLENNGITQTFVDENEIQTERRNENVRW
nr:MAG TPA: hypothetical protein [Caudoviricetes sp.]